MRLLTFTTLYPNAAQPYLGLFVEARLQRLVATGEISAEVIAPVAWFPFRGRIFGRYGDVARVPATECRGGIEVTHPRYPLIPKVGMALAPGFMARALERHIEARARERPFDILDAHYFYPDGVAAARLARKLGCPCVITARGSDVNLLPEFASPRRQILEAARACSGIITVSEALKRRLVELGADESKITVLPNGVDLTAFRPDSEEQAALDGPARSRTFLSVANLLPNKRLDVVIRGLSQVPDATLLVIGAGPLRRSLEDLSRSIGMSNRVSFLGLVPHEELAAYYNRAAATILVSEKEGMPNVVLESLACGTRVIASRAGGIPELVTNERAGILLDEVTPDTLAEAASRVLSEPRRTDAVRAQAERFGWSETVRRQIDLYRRILACGAERQHTTAD